MTPGQLRDLADFLAKEPNCPPLDKEVVLRSAVRTYYYAAFHHAMDWAETNTAFVRTNTGGDHSGVRRSLPGRRQIIKDDLQELYDYRGLCDYDPDPIPNIAMIIAEAKKLCASVFTL